MLKLLSIITIIFIVCVYPLRLLNNKYVDLNPPDLILSSLGDATKFNKNKSSQESIPPNILNASVANINSVNGISISEIRDPSRLQALQSIVDVVDADLYDISFDRNQLDDVRVGEFFRLPISEYSEVDFSIDSVELLPSGRLLQGNVVGKAPGFSANIIYSDEQMYGSVITADKVIKIITPAIGGPLLVSMDHQTIKPNDPPNKPSI